MRFHLTSRDDMAGIIGAFFKFAPLKFAKMGRLRTARGPMSCYTSLGTLDVTNIAKNEGSFVAAFKISHSSDIVRLRILTIAGIHKFI